MKIEYALEKYTREKQMTEQYNWDKIDKSIIGGGIGDGVNKFDIPMMYKNYMKRELDYCKQFSLYGNAEGSELLCEVLKLYEKMMVGTDNDNFCNYISVTCGATAAIYFLFRYFAEKYNNYKVKMLGLQYIIFEDNCKYNNLKYEYIVSENKNRILPTIDEICINLSKEERNIVILTIPGNPSGEIYSYQEIVEICRLCLNNNSVLVIDKCQLEVLTDSFPLINIGAAVLEANAENITIFIDSLSKMRSLPGIRLGYIFSNNFELSQYIRSYSALVYTCPIRGIESAIVMDMLARVIYYYKTKDKKIISRFRNLIIMYNGYEEYQRIYDRVFVDGLLLDSVLTQFICEIEQNSSIIASNYKKAKDLLYGANEREITNLQGGFNFCIRIRDSQRKGEQYVLSRITNILNMKVLSQCFFGGEEGKIEEIGYWIRLSVAMHEADFEVILEKIKRGLELMED